MQRYLDRWELLDPVTRAEIEEAIKWLRGRPEKRAVPAYFVDDDQDRDTGVDYCREHADTLAAERRADGVVGVYIGRQETCDGSSWCETCGQRLHVYLTDFGVDSELGITETDPLYVRLDIDGAEQTAAAMLSDDPRWPLWLWHVDIMRAKARS